MRTEAAQQLRLRLEADALNGNINADAFFRMLSDEGRHVVLGGIEADCIRHQLFRQIAAIGIRLAHEDGRGTFGCLGPLSGPEMDSPHSAL